MAGGTPTASVSANSGNNAAYLTGTGNLATANMQTLTLGGSSTGNIVLDSGSGLITLSDATTFSGLGTFNAGATIASGQNLTLAGITANNNQVLYAANATGIVTSANTSSQNLCLVSGASSPTWQSCALGAGTNFWNSSNGALYPGNSTLDLLVGGTASSAAKFAVLNMAGGTPTASVSAGTAGGAFLTATGNLQTTAKQSLTLGGGNTGNLVLSGFGTGLVHSNSSGVLSSSAVNLANADVTGILPLGNGGTGLNITGSSITDGQLLIGNNSSDGFSLAALTAGSGIDIANGSGTITISQAGGSSSKWTQSNSLGTLTPNISTLDLLVGGTATSSAKFAVLNMAGGTPTASVSANSGNNAAYLTGTGNLATANMQTLTLGGSSTGNIVLDSGSGLITLSDATTFSGLGTFNAGATIASGQNLTLAGITANNNQVLYAANATGIVTSANTSSQNLCLVSGASSPTWQSCALGAGTNFWNSSNGALYPGNSTLDLLVGGTASSAAKFAVLNMAGGTPTASVSAGTAGGAFLTATGNLQTTAKQSLTLGGGNTGNLVLSGFGTGLVHSNSSGVLSSSAVNLANADVTGILPLGNGGTGLNITGSSITDGQLLIGNNSSDGFSLAALTAGSGIDIANGSGTITISQAGGSSSKWTQSNSLGTLTPNISTLDLLVGGTATSSAKFAVLNMAGGTPTASVSANSGNNAAYLTGTGNLATANMQTLTLGGSSTGNIVLDSGSGLITLSDATTFSGLGTFNAGATIASGQNLTLAGITANNNQVLYAANATGIVTSANTSSQNLCLVSGASSPTWQSCALGAGTNFWNSSNGALYPGNSTLDLLVGGTASSAAKFAVLNMAGGTPTASVSSGLNGTAAYLTSDGTLATTKRQTLTIGNSSTYNTTGNILLNPNGTGNVGIGTSSPLATLDVNGTASISGALKLYGTPTIQSTANQTLTLGGDTTGNIVLSDLALFNAGATIASGENLTLAGITGNNACSMQLQQQEWSQEQQPNSQNLCLVSGASAPTWQSCALGAGTNWWDSTAGAIYPNNSTKDLLIGGTATSSAEFSVLGIAAGTNPTASVSATSGGNSGNGIVLAADGSIQSLRNNTLTLGGNTTGNMVLAPLNGLGVINFDVATSNGLQINGTNGATVTASCVTTLNGIVTAGSACESGADTWTLNAALGIVHTSNQTTDVLIGGTASSSAKVKFSPSGTSPTASISAQTSYAAMVVDNKGVGDLFTASTSGVSKFTIANNGSLKSSH